jgi:hypothetical protein
MSQFRTTADILDEVLQKSGEPTNGNSLYETIARTYLNKAHHAIVGGGNLFNLDVDEPWVWARSRHPIVLELEPAYITGSVTVTYGDINITFSSPPSASLEGWFFQVIGKSTIYRLTEHTTSVAAAVLDSAFVDDSGTYKFRAFKLDYEIKPAYLYVDEKNDRIDFQEGTAYTTRTASLTHGSYTPSNYLSQVVAQLNSISTSSITGTHDSVIKRNTINGASALRFLGVSGANAKRSALPTLGFDILDYTTATAAVSYTSSYTPNSISRLIEPFKLFTSQGCQPFVYSSDPIRMQEDYPMHLTREGVPDRFVRLTEENDGTIWVRFNAYPKYKTKLMLDWIPTPIDLQDNSVSAPALPRGDVDTLIHAASAFLCLDKEDSKYELYANLAKAGLQGMKKKNHSLLHRTGATFGQMVPRADLMERKTALRYGYTVSGSTASQVTAAETPESMIQVILGYANFQTGATVNTVAARTLPSNRQLFSLIIKHSQSFTGAALAAVNLDVGVSGDPTRFISNFDVMQAVASTAQDSQLVMYFPATATDIQVRARSNGANLSALTQGSVTLYFQEWVVTS